MFYSSMWYYGAHANRFDSFSVVHYAWQMAQIFWKAKIYLIKRKY